MSVLTGLRELVIDAWASMSHKAPLSEDPKNRLTGYTPKTWVGEEHRRRITAYQILAAYEANVSRVFLSTDDPADVDERREYGDAGLIIDTVLSSLLGEQQEIVVDGADRYDPDLEQPVATTGDDGATTEPDRAELEAWEANEAARVLAERQQFLRDWADQVHLDLRLVDCERNGVRYGDGVWLLGWDAAKKRPVPAVMDPGFYFPVLPDTLDAYDYPERVHFAWEIPGEDFPDNKTRVRRITYDLRDLEYDVVELPDGTLEAVLPEGADLVTVPAGPGDDVDENGAPGTVQRIVRTYPWSSEPSTKTVYVTDATWILDDLDDPSNVDAFAVSAAERIEEDSSGNLLDDFDLGVDFIPVIHVPNTPPGGDHYGQSSLARVLQLLDDLQGADTDAQASSATTGSPITWSNGPTPHDPLTGQRGTERQVKPGTHWHLGEDGQAGSIDTAANLAATREYVLSLRDRMLVNSRLPAAVVGTLKPTEVPSGYALQLSFGPLTAMVRTMRLVRSVKYPLLLKMVQRFYQLNGLLPEGDSPRAELRLGSFLPSDQAGTLDRVQKAYDAKLISLETAVGTLLEAGFSIDDVAEEVVRIEKRDYGAANELADATGDNAAVRELLHLAPAPTGVPSVVLPPPVPGGES